MLALTKCSRSRRTKDRVSASAIALGDPGRPVLVADILGEHGELVAAEARDGVARAQRLLEPGGDGREQLVAGRVARGCR